ncbi:MAG: hypothetical protein RJA24_1555 [Pseudomonadota bacterium]
MIDIRINGQPHPFDHPPSVSEVLETLGLTGKRIAVERNGCIVPKSLHGTTLCATGDTIEIVVAVGGG